MKRLIAFTLVLASVLLAIGCKKEASLTFNDPVGRSVHDIPIVEEPSPPPQKETPAPVKKRKITEEEEALGAWLGEWKLKETVTPGNGQSRVGTPVRAVGVWKERGKSIEVRWFRKRNGRETSGRIYQIEYDPGQELYKISQKPKFDIPAYIVFHSRYDAASRTLKGESVRSPPGIKISWMFRPVGRNGFILKEEVSGGRGSGTVIKYEGTSTQSIKLTPKEAAEVMQLGVGQWEAKGQYWGIQEGSKSFTAESAIRWKEKGRSIKGEVSMTIDGVQQPKYYFENEYEPTSGLFIGRLKDASGEFKVDGYSLYDPTTLTKRAVMSVDPTDDGLEVINESSITGTGRRVRRVRVYDPKGTLIQKVDSEERRKPE